MGCEGAYTKKCESKGNTSWNSPGKENLAQFMDVTGFVNPKHEKKIPGLFFFQKSPYQLVSSPLNVFASTATNNKKTCVKNFY